jgi:hypothetical protein
VKEDPVALTLLKTQPLQRGEWREKNRSCKAPLSGSQRPPFRKSTKPMNPSNKWRFRPRKIQKGPRRLPKRRLKKSLKPWTITNSPDQSPAPSGPSPYPTLKNLD